MQMIEWLLAGAVLAYIMWTAVGRMMLVLLLGVLVFDASAGRLRLLNTSTNFFEVTLSGGNGVTNIQGWLVAPMMGNLQTSSATYTVDVPLDYFISTLSGPSGMTITVVNSVGISVASFNVYNGPSILGGFDVRGDAELDVVETYVAAGSGHQNTVLAYKPPSFASLFALDFTEPMLYFWSGWGLVTGWFGLWWVVKIVRKVSHGTAYQPSSEL